MVFRKITFLTLCVVFIAALIFIFTHSLVFAKSVDKEYQHYINFFEEVYETVDNNYFAPVSRSDFDRFIEQFNEKIYSQLKSEGKSIDYVRWRSAAYLVDYLIRPDDPFSQFYPPPTVKEYEQEVYGKRVDLGIEGERIDVGYHVQHVEPRSDAYQQGMRDQDLIIRINQHDVTAMSEDEIEKALVPLEGDEVEIQFLNHVTKLPRVIKVKSREYFKQTVFMASTGVPGIFALEIRKFNRKTGEDMLRFLQHIKTENPKGLILDLRGNPGGPPLAAREIASFFLEPGSDFVYFEGRHKPKAALDVPVIPEEFRFKGPIVILVNEKSGSASELFSFTMQDADRAIIMGRNTAGLVYLKSLFHFDDKSMVALMTSLAHFPDGRPFSLNGVTPDERPPEDVMDNLITMAAKYMYLNQEQSMKVN